jgi:hypothetical protein
MQYILKTLQSAKESIQVLAPSCLRSNIAIINLHHLALLKK